MVCLDVLSAGDVGDSFLSMSLDLLRGTRLVDKVEEVVASSLLEKDEKGAVISKLPQYYDSLYIMRTRALCYREKMS